MRARARTTSRKPRARSSTSAAPRRAAEGGTEGSAWSASRRIDRRIRELGDWRGKTLARVRAIVRRADPKIVEEWKWETPVWSRGGILLTGEAYGSAVKLTFARGASLGDPARLFHASLEGKVRRAIDLRDGEEVDGAALADLVREAVAVNLGSRPRSAAAKPRLLAGGNPQIAKGEGDAPVRAWLAALPGWKRDVGRRIDALVARAVPGVKKAVKWNSPLYGVAGRGWFLGVHAFTHHLKLTFVRGASLRPLPPGASKTKDVRHLDVREDDAFDEARLARWLSQASRLPGWGQD